VPEENKKTKKEIIQINIKQSIQDTMGIQEAREKRRVSEG
jgi:hypothetical protein